MSRQATFERQRHVGIRAEGSTTLGTWKVGHIGRGERNIELRPLDDRLYLGPVYNLRIRSTTERDRDGGPKIIESLIMQGTRFFLYEIDELHFEGFVEVNADGSPFRDYDFEPTGVYAHETWIWRGAR